MSDKKVIISIEGNIGVGKSTFINILKSNWDLGTCTVVNEPIDIWTNLKNSDGKNILQTFYEDVSRWAYTFQNIACITRMMKIEESIKNSTSKYIFLDRSLGTDKNVFEAMLYDDGKLSQIEHQMYNLWCDFYYKYVRSELDQIYIYLKAKPKICEQRIKKRGRIEETNIDLKYLEGLNDYHDKWLLNESNVIIIDCDDDFETNKTKQNDMINQIKLKLNSINKKNKIKVESKHGVDFEDFKEFEENIDPDLKIKKI